MLHDCVHVQEFVLSIIVFIQSVCSWCCWEKEGADAESTQLEKQKASRNQVEETERAEPAA